MACRQNGTVPLSKTTLTIGQLDPEEFLSVKFQSNRNCFHWSGRKCIWICCLPRVPPSCFGHNVSTKAKTQGTCSTGIARNCATQCTHRSSTNSAYPPVLEWICIMCIYYSRWTIFQHSGFLENNEHVLALYCKVLAGIEVRMMYAKPMRDGVTL